MVSSMLYMFADDTKLIRTPQDRVLLQRDLLIGVTGGKCPLMWTSVHW